MKTTSIDLVGKTIHDIQGYIELNGLKEGAKLPTEQQWLNLLHVGRSTLREAMKVLTYSGEIRVRQGSGSYVATGLSANHDNEKQLFALEKMLESEAIVEIGNRSVADEEWGALGTLLAKRNRLLEAGKMLEYVNADIAFHTQIVRMSGNDHLMQWFQEIGGAWQQHLNVLISSQKRYRGNTENHNKLYETLMNGETAMALELIRKVGR